MKRKVVFIMFALMLVSQAFISGTGLMQTPMASEPGQGILTDVSLTDEFGNLLDSEQNPDYQADIDGLVKINYYWSLKGETSSDRDSYSFALPEQLKVNKAQQGDLISKDGSTVGSYQVSPDGTLIVTLSENEDNSESFEGKFVIETKMNGEVINDAETVSIPFHLSNKQKVINVSLQTKQLEKKDAQPDEDEAISNDEESKETDGNTINEKDDVMVESKEATDESDIKEEMTEGNENLEKSQNVQYESVEIQENIMTDFELTLRNGDPLPDPMPNPNENELEMKAKYSFALPNDHTYGAGSTYTFELPELLKVYNEVSGNLGDYGTYTVSTDGQVVLTFNEKIESYSEIEGWLEIYSIIDKQIEGSTEQKIIVPIKDGASKEITIQFEPREGSAIDKRGTPDQKYNATSITWEVDFNKNLAVLNNAKLLDPIEDESQNFKPGSIKIYKLDVLLDGSVKLGEEVTSDYGTEFPIDFGTINSEAFRVVFETEITDGEGTSYPNTATLKWDGGELPAKATVAVSRGKALEKKAIHYDSNSQIITWEVKYNYNEKFIPKEQAILTDVFGNNQTLIENSFHVYEVTINSETGAEAGQTEVGTEAYTITDKNDGFTFQFQNDIDKAYKIQYKTTAIDRVIDNGIAANTITDEFNHEATGSQDISQGVFIKSLDGTKTNYTQKETGWRLEFNKDRYTMKNVIVTDTLPKGFTPKDVKVIVNGLQQLPDADYTYSYDENNGVMKFVFHNEITEQITITFLTDIDYNLTEPGVNSFKNQAIIEWESEDGQSHSKTGEATFTPNQDTRLNGSKGGYYNAINKEITWTIGINYNNRHIEEAIVEDVIQGNQNLDLDSISVYKMEIHPNGTWSIGEQLPSDQYSIVEMESEGEPGFRVNLGEIDSAYVLVFNTSIEGELIVNKYDNKAVLKDGNTEFPVTATVTVNNGGNYSAKAAVQNGENEEIINWTITINATQSTLESAKLTDKPSSNQVILKDSFVLFGTDVSSNGSFTKNAEDILEKGKDYTLEFKKDGDGNEFFELTFLNKINRPYILEYDTFAMAGHGEKVNNHAELTGKNITTEKTDSQKEITVRYSGGDGGASGKNGKLTITKLDAATKEPLKGVEFTLFDKTGTIALLTETTNADGKIVFDNLRFGDYILKETKVPEGYLISDADGKSVKVDKEVNDSEDKGNTLIVENQPIIYAAELTKVDADDPSNTLAGAKFELQKKTDGEFKTIEKNLTTNENGIIYVDELEPGDYQFVEKTAPKGYLLNQEPIPFTIVEQAIEAVKITAENTAIDQTSVSGKKIWKDDNSPDRPETITVKLLQNGKELRSKDVTAEKNWQYSFDNLPKTNSLGEPYTYTVEELAVEGYQSTIEGTDITNLRVGKTSVKGTKTWKDGNSADRPESIIVKLLQNGEEMGSKEVSAANNWKYSFVELEKYDENGVAYKYTIVEEEVQGYKTSITGYDITNLRVGKTSVEGTKTWKDDDSPDRPETITVKLFQNGKEMDVKEVTEKDNWKYSFTDLPAFDNDGVAYKYTIGEESVKGYETTIDGYDITNLRVGNTSVEGTKTWKDGDSETRPDMIKVNLLQNGVVIDTHEVTADTDWKYSFTGLDQYDKDGKAYVYTVKEHGVPGYKSSVKGYDITNTRSELTNVVVTKAWKDDNSADRPNSVTVKLLQNGQVIESVEVNASEDWTYEFKDLQAFDEEGIAYVYTVEEEPVEGYETTIDGYDITNLRVGQTSVEGTKTWEDDNFKNRPSMIKVDLLQNETVIATAEVSDETDWEYSFTDLEKYDPDGKEYAYTIMEHSVEGYESVLTGYDITNKLILGSVELLKVDKKDHHRTLEGAEFKLQDAEGNLLKEGLKTDSHGRIVIENLQPGDYQFIETKAPEGYELNSSPISFTIEMGQTEKETVLAENNKKPDEDDSYEPGVKDSDNKQDEKEPTKKGKNLLPATATSIYNIGLVGVLILSGGLLLLMRRKRS